MYKALSVRCQRCTKKKKNKKITHRCMVTGTCAVKCLHYIPLYRNTQHYATLNCSVKRVYAPEAHKSPLQYSKITTEIFYSVQYCVFITDAFTCARYMSTLLFHRNQLNLLSYRGSFQSCIYLMENNHCK